MSRSIFRSDFLYVVSKAALKSTKLKGSEASCSFPFSINCQTITKARSAAKFTLSDHLSCICLHIAEKYFSKTLRDRENWYCAITDWCLLVVFFVYRTYYHLCPDLWCFSVWYTVMKTLCNIACTGSPPTFSTSAVMTYIPGAYLFFILAIAFFLFYPLLFLYVSQRPAGLRKV